MATSNPPILFEDWLKNSKYSITQLANELGLVRGSIYAYLNGTAYPSGKVLLKLSTISNGAITIESFRLK